MPGTTTATADGYINPSNTLFKGRATIVPAIPAIAVSERLYVPSYDASKAIMTCATCHDVHNRKNGDDPALGLNYLVMAPQRDSSLCLTCHIK